MMRSNLDKEQIVAAYRKIRIWYYGLLLASVLAFFALYILSTKVEGVPAMLKITMLLVILGVQAVRFFMARGPVCGMFLAFMTPIPLILPRKCTNCKTLLIKEKTN